MADTSKRFSECSQRPAAREWLAAMFRGVLSLVMDDHPQRTGLLADPRRAPSRPAHVPAATHPAASVEKRVVRSSLSACAPVVGALYLIAFAAQNVQQQFAEKFVILHDQNRWFVSTSFRDAVPPESRPRLAAAHPTFAPLVAVKFKTGRTSRRNLQAGQPSYFLCPQQMQSHSKRPQDYREANVR